MARGRRPPLYRRGPGVCSWCGNEIVDAQGKKNKRRRWHRACLYEYRGMAWSGYIRKKVFARDHGICAKCGTKGPWQADHTIPLWSVPRPIRVEDRERWFGLSNLATLCLPCHKEKTRAEAKERARIKRTQNPKPKYIRERE